MKIAPVSPLFESGPPPCYGGTEHVDSWLTEELGRQGHDVTVFASIDSVTSAELVPVIPGSARPEMGRPAWLAYHMLEMDLVSDLAGTFDIIHLHVNPHYLRTPHITALHDRLDRPERFGLVMIGAFACGTPVAAYCMGRATEGTLRGVAGFMFSDQEEAVRAARDIGSIGKSRCRQVFDRYFTVARMAARYMRVYVHVMSRHRGRCDRVPAWREHGRTISRPLRSAPGAC